MDPATDPLEERFNDIERKKATHQIVDSFFAILVISIQSVFEVSIIFFGAVPDNGLQTALKPLI
jgi:hypothetical protein